MKTLCVVLLFAGLAVAQTKFVDNSPNPSPIRLAVLNVEGNCSIVAVNKDKRPIVALVVDFKTDLETGRMTHDHFFKSDEHVSMHGFQFPIEEFPCDNKSAEATTKLVQFSDGEFWESSDPATVTELAQDRRDATEYLGQVILDVTKLSQKTTTLVTSRERELLKSVNDPVSTAKERINNAGLHSSWLN